MRVGLTDRGRALLGGGSVLAVAGLGLGFVDLTRIGLAALILVLASAATHVASHPFVEGEVVLPRTAHARWASPLVLRLRLRRRTWTPLDLEPTGDPTGALSLPALRIPAGAPPHLDLTSTLTPTRRGLHHLPPLRTTSVDAFGLTRMRRTAGTSDTPILVLPRLRDLDDTLRRGPASGAARLLPTSTGDDLGSLRDYVPGDDLRRIHWPVTAHRGRLVTRHEEPSPSPRLVVTLDPGLPAPHVEEAVEVAASIVATAVRHDVPFDLALPAVTGAGPSVLDDEESAMVALALLPADPHAWAGRGRWWTEVSAVAEGAASVLVVTGPGDGGGPPLPSGAVGTLLRVGASPTPPRSHPAAVTPGGWSVVDVPPPGASRHTAADASGRAR